MFGIATLTIAGEEHPAPTSLPHISYTGGFIDYDWNDGRGHRDKTLERVQYLAKRRNNAVRLLTTTFPDITHVLMIDSYFLGQRKQLETFVIDYTNYTEQYPSGYIMGGSTWFRSYLFPYTRIQFWDTWTTPEMRDLSPKKNGMFRVKSVGGVIMFPLVAWRDHPFDDSQWPRGCEMNGFCENSRMPVILNAYRKFDHPNPRRYSILKSFRVRAGYWRPRL